jgi:hypothetical protein
MTHRLKRWHPAYKTALPSGEYADIDVKIIKLLRAAWALGYTTQYSCQGDADRQAMIIFDGDVTALKIADLCQLEDTFCYPDGTMPAVVRRDPTARYVEILHDEWGPRSILWFPHESIRGMTAALTRHLVEVLG